MKQFDIFRVAILKEEFNIDLCSLVKYCYDLKSKSDGRLLTNMGGWQSEPVESHVAIKDLKCSLENKAEEVSEAFSLKSDLKLSNMWININGYKDYNETHIHPMSKVSGCFYVKVPENPGSLKLVNPAVTEMNNWSYHINEFTPYNSAIWEMYPFENVAYFFPSWLYHGVYPNMNKEEDRISIAFNYI